MKSINLSGSNKEINIVSRGEVTSISDIFNELIFPALNAYGYKKEDIDNALFEQLNPIAVREYRREYRIQPLIEPQPSLDEEFEVDDFFEDDEEFEDDVDDNPPSEEPKRIEGWSTVDVRLDSNTWDTGVRGGMARTIQEQNDNIWSTSPFDKKPVQAAPTAPPPVLKPKEPEEDKSELTKALQYGVQQLFDEGKWDFNIEMPKIRRIGCREAPKLFQDIDCKHSCNLCPIYTKDVSMSLKYGLFTCPDCNARFNKPFPRGFCPECGIHSTITNKKEFCGLHWDLNRPHSDYEADEDEN